MLFHGRGADENDLFPLLDFLDPERRLVAATPRGPLSLPPGGAHGNKGNEAADAALEMAELMRTLPRRR